MTVRKIAISVPEDVLARVDRMALKVGSTRSGFITQVLCEVSRAKGQAEITERINQLFSAPDVLNEQTETATSYLKAADSDGSEGTGW